MPPSSNDPSGRRRAPAGRRDQIMRDARRQQRPSRARTPTTPADFTLPLRPEPCPASRREADRTTSGRVRAAGRTASRGRLGTRVVERSGATASMPLPASRRRARAQRRRPGVRSTSSTTELGKGIVTPEHYVHVAAIGNGRSCPATEPAETGLGEAWPPRTRRRRAPGKGVQRAVVDTGWMAAANDHAWLATASTVTRSRSGRPARVRRPRHVHRGRGPVPGARRRDPHSEFPIQRGGAVRESHWSRSSDEALDRTTPAGHQPVGRHPHPRRPSAQELPAALGDHGSSSMPNTVLVAAAGNEGSTVAVLPGGLPWAVGVGSLDRDGGSRASPTTGCRPTSSCSAATTSTRYPRGPLRLQGDARQGRRARVRHGLARWSGTSFAAPLMAGIVAALAGAGIHGRTGRRPRSRTEVLSERRRSKHGTTPSAASTNYIARPYR